MARTLVVVGWVWPEPQASAAGHNTLTLLQTFLQHQWQVIFASPAEWTPLSFPLRELGIQCQTIAVNDSSFDEWLASVAPDVVVFDRFLMEEQFGWRVELACPDALRILDTSDLQCLRHGRQQAYRAGREFSTEELNTDLALRELAAIWRSDLSLIISREEQQLLLDHFGVRDSLLFLRPLQLQHAGERSAPLPGFDERKGFVTIGNFRHAPNWDAVLYLQSLWPEVRRALPGAEIRIYGAYMPPKAKQLHNPKQGFYMLGWVEDAQTAMASARVCVAPLRYGAGQKGKLLLAMAAATPSVTTSVGAESMIGGDDWPGVVADEPAELVAAMVALHEDATEWQHCSESALACARAISEADSSAQLMTQIDQLLAGLPGHRQRNFIGAMLRHHHQRSTEYFSRWIETKSRLAKPSQAE
ncbi:glycosyltransferase family 4 protein [Halioxenophilus sp. WMMB6]|uniref:glycosyltransferase n=1 Tax=Halioxenophilus sp. WMMB6 TaxID=3073815 RepID=UPI00295E67A8|nr:glycosyltransferase family 4 protein [Halioxenophilus sp. WMMB6]